MDLVAAQRIASRLDGLSTAPDGTGQFVFDRDAKLLCWDHDGRGDAPAIQIADLSTPTGWSGSEVVVIV